ncbi:MAG: hypothetical protein K2X06_13765, partial [Burkholderiales bacterium]|nr:hypothetical protein [Burkholderiales bacterium]
MPRIVITIFNRLLQSKSRVVGFLITVLVANILTAGAGLTAPVNWQEHEKSHLAALHDPHFQDATPSAPDQPA